MRIYEESLRNKTEGTEEHTAGPLHLKDDEALRFYGNYVDIHGSKHKISVLVFYDNSVQIHEKKTMNAGCPQGTVVRKSKVPASLGSKEILTWKDFNVGQSVAVYGRHYNLLGCDKFTRNFLTSHGVQVAADASEDELHDKPQQAVPLVDYDKPKLRIAPRNRPTRIGKNYFSKDGMVLRFYGVWDESKAIYGQLHRFMVHYYLADDSIEIRELQAGKNASHSVIYVRRQKLPKHFAGPEISSASSTSSMLALSGSGAGQNNELFTEDDLSIGTVLNVYGRPIYLCDCDGFTRDYFKQQRSTDLKKGVPVEHVIAFNAETGELSTTDDESYKIKVQQEQKRITAEPEAPSILPGAKAAPKVRRQNVADADALNCVARIKSTDSLEQQRSFTIRVFLLDDTIAIFEKAVLNSGLPGGKYLERRSVKKSDGGYLGAQDFKIGAELNIYGKNFIIEDMDNFSKHWIAENCN